MPNDYVFVKIGVCVHGELETHAYRKEIYRCQDHQEAAVVLGANVGCCVDYTSHDPRLVLAQAVASFANVSGGEKYEDYAPGTDDGDVSSLEELWAQMANCAKRYSDIVRGKLPGDGGEVEEDDDD